MQTQTTNTTIFINLLNALKSEKFNQLKEFTEELNNYNSVEEILKTWKYNDLLPKGKKEKLSTWDLGAVKNYIIDRKVKQHGKYIAAKLKHLQTVEQAEDLESITVSVEWKKSRMWGNNPTADARVCDKQYGYNYNSGSIGGCGYDKESTAIANAINQSNQFLKAMYTMKENNITVKNHELFGYGSGYGILPQLEGGVGVSCYPKIFEKLGFEFKHTAGGKTFDVYTVAKK